MTTKPYWETGSTNHRAAVKLKEQLQKPKLVRIDWGHYATRLVHRRHEIWWSRLVWKGIRRKLLMSNKKRLLIFSPVLNMRCFVCCFFEEINRNIKSGVGIPGVTFSAFFLYFWKTNVRFELISVRKTAVRQKMRYLRMSIEICEGHQTPEEVPGDLETRLRLRCAQTTAWSDLCWENRLFYLRSCPLAFITVALHHWNNVAGITGQLFVGWKCKCLKDKFSHLSISFYSVRVQDRNFGVKGGSVMWYVCVGASLVVTVWRECELFQSAKLLKKYHVSCT